MCLLSVNSSTSKQPASHQHRVCFSIINIFALHFLVIFWKTRIAYIFFLKSTDLVRNIDPITSNFVSNLDLATTIQRLQVCD